MEQSQKGQKILDCSSGIHPVYKQYFERKLKTSSRQVRIKLNDTKKEQTKDK